MRLGVVLALFCAGSSSGFAADTPTVLDAAPATSGAPAGAGAAAAGAPAAPATAARSGTSAAPEAPVPAATSAAAAGAAAPGASPAPGEHGNSDVTPEQIKQMRGKGYKPKLVNGVTYFCRNEAPIGSRLERQTCSTLDELKQRQLDGKEYTEKVQYWGAGAESKT